MKLPRLLLAAAALAFLPGCVGYTKFRATDVRGGTIAEWTGRGFFYPVTGGYAITAVERISGPPHPIESRYPHGRRTTVTGAHVEHWPTERPLWMDGDSSYSERTDREYKVVYESETDAAPR